jgi:hypothetical protein
MWCTPSLSGHSIKCKLGADIGNGIENSLFL